MLQAYSISYSSNAGLSPDSKGAVSGDTVKRNAGGMWNDPWNTSKLRFDTYRLVGK